MTNAEDIARGLKRPRGGNKVAEKADWMECNSALLQKVVAEAGYKHCALRLGYSRDGGAYAIGVYAGADYFTDYIRPGESIDDYLRELLVSLEEYVPGDTITPNAHKAKGKR